MTKSKNPNRITVPEEHRLIDVEKAIRDKNPKLLKWMPGLLMRYIKKTLHQEELNEIIYRNSHKQGKDFIDAGVEEMGINVTYSGLENIPTEGGVYLAANHPLGGLDGVAFMHVVSQVRLDLKFFVNDLLMQVKNYGPFFVPVNKHGMNGRDYKHRFEAVYQSEECLLIFPAGLVSRKQSGGRIEDLQWKKSIILKAQEYNKPIIPVHITAKNSNKFYNIAYWRKKFGIKANLEMFFLADEMFKQRGKTIHFEIGKPIPASHWDESKKPEEWVQWLKEKVYSMPSQ
ncbi:MAG: 1-acyl-sn-glycerol-3-phosphate acyltransferase [Flavobacteriales bacterium]|nr:1-acyl-sn-glycerol-3-phosphate acyltransferase [Flavobacteriales bacterium]MCB9196887.1 1-acyl-sn-glycerol-3-phosphate acyltransferase [Flavobacteriales bacterium]